MSFATWFFDYDNDGWLDIFVSRLLGADAEHRAPRCSATRPNAAGERPGSTATTATAPSPTSRASVGLDRLLLPMGANFGDLDNDGWLDFYLGTGAPPLYHARAEPDVPQRRRPRASRT